jgi:MSHA biogenesis protein MshO
LPPDIERTIRDMSRRTPSCRGFTLIEMVVAISISAIFVVFASLFIQAPVDSYLSQSRHAELLDSASAAWPRIERDIHRALPTSVRARRNGNIWVLETLRVAGSARYMTAPGASSITLAGVFDDLPHPFGPTAPGDYFVTILGAGANPWQLGSATTPANRRFRVAASPANPNEDVLTVTPQFGFPAGDSPKRYLYFVSGPITFLCDQTQGTIRRYSDYTIATNQASRDTAAELNAAGATSELVARNITACRFVAPPGNASRGQIVTVQITATRGTESSTLLHQAATDMPR